jgi:hypothetical protein
MARTSRGQAPAASVDALDNLNLDDMFAGDDMALLDGLDIDLDNMDDIAGMDDAKIEPLAAQMEMDDESLLEAEAEVQSPTSKRRKPKRKTKAPFFFDEDDDEYVDEKKKKKKGAKAVPKKKGTTKKASAPPPAPDSKQAPATTKTTKTKSRMSAAMPPPLARGSSNSTAPSHVAAAGQFGGRQKRGPNSGGLPMSKSSKNKGSSVSSKSSNDTTSKLKSKASATPVAIPPPPAQAAEPTLQQIQAMHAQNSYCGLLPSNTLFYPFMPTLPNEPSLKNRKLFPLMDRIYSSLMSHMSSTGKADNGIPRVGEMEAIYQLLHDAYKEEKPASTAPNSAQLPPDKTEIVGTAIGSLRRTISLFDKDKLAGDLYGVCALLKRQHDFLKQNSANMEKWCKDNFTETDYASVYSPLKASRKRKSSDAPAAVPVPPPSILASFEASLLRVKIVCTGFKDPKSSGPLMAQLPPLFLPQGMGVKANSVERPKPPTKPTKKRKLSTPAEPKPPPAVKVEPVPKEAPTYTQMKPGRRRKALAELISRVAKDIESKLLQRVDDGHVSIERQQSDMLKLASEDEGLTMQTSGMWNWVDKSGYFGTCSEEELRRRFNGVRSHVSEQHGSHVPSGAGQIFPGQKPQQVADESLVDRLQSLLVEEETEDSNGDDGDEDDKVEDDLYLDNSDSYPASQLADLSSLSLDERLFLHVRSVGLADSLILPESTSSRESISQPTDNGFRRDERIKSLPTVVDDLDETIDAMTNDLDKLAGLNNLRADFLESVASSNFLSADEWKRKSDEEANAITRFQNLLKKTKETKVKNGKPKALKNDANALPW